jgi:hypothetical protein
MNATPAVEADHSNRMPWIMVSAVIAAAVLFGIALIVGNGVLIVVAIAVVVLTALAAAVLPRRVGRPISFTEEFPANTYGPRATVDGDSTPPINTRQHPEAMAPDARIREVEALDSPEPPDDDRVFPQYVNLSPDDRLRSKYGDTYIEKRQDVPQEDVEEEEGIVWPSTRRNSGR